MAIPSPDDVSTLEKVLSRISFKDVFILILLVLVLVLYLDRDKIYSFLTGEYDTQVIGTCSYVLEGDKFLMFHRIPYAGVYPVFATSFGEVNDEADLTLREVCATLEEVGQQVTQ